MAKTVRKKSSYVFSPPSYIKKAGVLESKVEKIINDTIRAKIFYLLDINRSVYIKLVEYFPVFTIQKQTGEKTLLSLMMRVKNKHIKFRELKAREIELSGVNVIEFNDFLENHGATEILNCALQLENL